MSEWQRTVRLGKRDASEPAVVDAFIAGGAVVVKHSGKDEPDLFVGFAGHWEPIESKTGTGKLTEGQIRWWRDVARRPPQIARTAPQARKWLGVWRDRAQSLSTFLRGANAAVGIESHCGGGVDAAIEENERGCACDACHCGGKLRSEPA